MRERERERKRFLRIVGNSRVEHGIHGIIRGLNIGWFRSVISLQFDEE